VSGHMMIMAGGTGGHVFPALAVAKQLSAQGTQITWLGTRRGLEARVIPANNIDIEWISIEGLRGKGLLSLLLAPFKLLRAMWQSASAIRRIKPDCVLGMGGFVAGPGGLVARIMGKPLIVHEQNAVAGLTNKYLAKIATRVLTGFPNVEELPVSAKWVGNPVRVEIDKANATKQQTNDDAVNVLIIGGSQGAHSFNTKLPKVFAELSASSNIDMSQVALWHQTGKGRDQAVVDQYAELGMTNANVTEFIDDMANAYQWADLLICRAGAMTIAECCAAAKPALLIPFPFSAGDHQIKNANVMCEVGAGEMLLNEQIETPEMQQTLAALLSNKQQLKAMGERAYQLHKPDALLAVAGVCEEYLNA